MLISIIWYLFMALYVIACLGLIGVILLQKGKGAGFAGAFGVGGGSDPIFGPASARTLPQRLTLILAVSFMVLAVVISILTGRATQGVAPALVEEAGISSQLGDLTIAPDAETPEVPVIVTEDAATAPVESEDAAAETAAPEDTAPPAEEAPAPDAPASEDTGS